MNAFMIWYLSGPGSQEISRLNGRLEKVVNVKIMLAATLPTQLQCVGFG